MTYVRVHQYVVRHICYVCVRFVCLFGYVSYMYVSHFVILCSHGYMRI